MDLDRASGVKELPSAETKDGRKCSTPHQMRLGDIRRRGAEMGRAWGRVQGCEDRPSASERAERDE